MFFEQNENFQDNNYISTWFRIAHEYCLNHLKKIEIEELNLNLQQNVKIPLLKCHLQVRLMIQRKLRYPMKTWL